MMLRNRTFFPALALFLLSLLRTSSGFLIPTTNQNIYHATTAAAIISAPLDPTDPTRLPILRTTTHLEASPRDDDEDAQAEERQARRKTQQLGAAAVLLVGVLYDFFVTHQGVGPWDPNYVL
mmetsp:Transcript_36473/g.43962  ORF Transcript_36473/g.43962 Transcript_36473/m.43962 type:complete len:122 (+) Transcript_36473:48-413(+)